MYEDFDPNSIEDIEKSIKVVERRIKRTIHLFHGIPKVLLIGDTGVGKSSLKNYLNGKAPEIIQGKGKSILLQGEGIFSGKKSGTTIPSLSHDTNNNVIYCDCPGFKDTKGIRQEIINAFAIDYLLSYNEKDNKVKVLLTVLASDFEDGLRGGNILDTLNRLKKMFPNIEELKRAIGLIITKGDPELIGSDYIEQLSDGCSGELMQWCEYFRANPNQVFTFPKASRKDVGKQYEFEDFAKLKDFLSKNYVINPIHKVTVSEKAILELKVARGEHSEIVKEVITDLFLKINENYRNLDGSSNIKTWLEIMHHLLEQKIKKINDFIKVIQKFIPNCDQYDDFIVILEDFEAFDFFIDKICEVDGITSILQETIRNLTHSAIKELEKNFSMTKESEIRDQMILEKNELIKRYESNIQKSERKITKLTAQYAREHSANLKNQKENQMQIEKLTNDLRNSFNLINQLKEDLNNQTKFTEDQSKRIKELENRPPKIIFGKNECQIF